ncbi:CorA family divalent cation transporter [Streptoalloteichus hindustanus]|uniref:Magnesium transporter n=1 Tax=Streptoalloteichus hindustanus TaxID=2017 RepID=A0A1M5D2Z5_STRHI|nr:CorA family divalent cation transporter [Streptoalloteichus hindustanus]SHF61351.1 magnesium transporter [Streptoalloteichus hindustanus]
MTSQAALEATMASTTLRRRWIQVAADDPAALTQASRSTGVDFAAAAGRVWETDDFVYLPVVVNVRRGDVLVREAVVFALGEDVLVTLQPRTPFAAFDKAIARIRRTPELTETPHGIMYALLYALNEVSERVIDSASDTLESMTDEITMATNGYDAQGREIGVTDMQDTIERMNEAEEIVSRSQETQLLLARAARHLRAEITPEHPRLAGLVDILIADVDGVKEHASYEHDKVRYLQQSIMTSLDVKQNQIVKVFTIITAVFLPPTLIATFYGMNFTKMPELAWEHGFLVTTTLTFVAALIPLWYIKRKGWLR